MNQDCSKALIPDTSNAALSELQQLSIAYMMNEAAFDEAKHAAGGGANFKLGPVSLDANGSYDDFRRELSTRAEKYGLDMFSKYASAYATSALSETSLKAYHDCLISNDGFEIVAVKRFKESYLLQVWRQPPPDVQDHMATLKFVHNISPNDLSDLEKVVANTKFSAKVEKQFSISPNDPKREIAFTIEAGPGTSAAIVLPPLDPWIPPIIQLSLAERSWKGVAFHAQISIDYRPDLNVGSIIRGSVYTVQRNTMSGSWTVVGNHEPEGTPITGTYPAAEPNAQGFFSLWGRVLKFTEDGVLYDYAGSEGHTGPNWVMGKVLF